MDSFKPKQIVQDTALVAGAGGSVVLTNLVLNTLLKKPEWNTKFVGAGANLVSASVLSVLVNVLTRKPDLAAKVFEGGKFVTYLRLIKAILPDTFVQKAGLNLSDYNSMGAGEKQKLIGQTAQYIADRLRQRGVSVPGFTNKLHDYAVATPTGIRMSDYVTTSGGLSGADHLYDDVASDY